MTAGRAAPLFLDNSDEDNAAALLDRRKRDKKQGKMDEGGRLHGASANSVCGQEEKAASGPSSEEGQAGAGDGMHNCGEQSISHAILF